MKKIRGDEPIGVITHVYMEISQGSSLGSLPLLQTSKNVILFSSTKSENRRTEQVLPSRGLVPGGDGRERRF
jgi:hypothetical protein